MGDNSSNIVDDVGDRKTEGLLVVNVREGTPVIPMVLRRYSEDGKIVLGLEQVVNCGFRKIEPKPKCESKSPEEEFSGDTQPPRFLESKSTRRGVRICPTCHGRVGYRSKVCKHCWLSTGNSTRTTSAHVKKKQIREKKGKMACTKNDTRIVSDNVPIVSLDDSCSPESVCNFDVDATDSKSEEGGSPVIYANLSEEISSVHNNPFHSINIASKVPSNINCSDGNADDICELKSHQDDDDKKSFDTEDQQFNSSSHKMKQNLMENSDQECISCTNNSSNLSDIADEGQDNSSLTSDVVNSFVNDITSEADNTKKLETSADDGEKSEDSIQPANYNREMLLDHRQNFEPHAEICNQHTGNEVNSENIAEDLNCDNCPVPVSEKDNHSSPVVLMDVNSVGSISVATTGENSQTINTKEYSVYMESLPSENTFVFENNDENQSKPISNSEEVNILAEIRVRSEQRGNLKRKKNSKLWQDLHIKRKKAASVQFVRIEPKPIAEINKDSGKEKQGTLKHNRILLSNATRRGVMLCPLCQKDVGCRSRTCKYCKVAINLCSTKHPLDQKNLLVVRLCEETCSQNIVFSVKKTLNASEDRCFVKKLKTTADKELPKNVFFCDCAVDNPMEKSFCEHTMCMFKGPKITEARNINFKFSKIESLPIDAIFKLKLNELWEKVRRNQFPLVQQVCQNTLVVLDVNSTPSTCVHVRFEKIRRRNSTELHIFCSGKTCSAWNEVEDAENDNPVTCIHYCVGLWAIASDNNLQNHLKMFLNATQVYLHSEVFNNLLKE